MLKWEKYFIKENLFEYDSARLICSFQYAVYFNLKVYEMAALFVNG